MTYAQPYTQAPPAGDPTAVVGRRIGAFAIDIVLMAILGAAVLIPIFLSSSEEVSTDQYRCESASVDEPVGLDDDRIAIRSSMCFQAGDTLRYVPDDETGSFTLRFYGIGLGLQALNLVVLQGLTGASVGKILLGLRVVGQDGKKAGFGWILLRWVLLFVDQICCFLPGAILVFTTKGHRRIGDMAAKTFVVSRYDAGKPVSVPGLTTGYGTPGYEAGGYPTQPTWAPPAGGSPSTFGSAPPAAATPAPGGGSAADGPTWDAARNAYIQYDRELGAWVQWSDAAGAWLPIDQ